MTKLTAWLILLFTGVVSMTAVNFARPDWAEAMGLDIWSLPHHHSRLASERERHLLMDHQGDYAKQRIFLKDHVIRELLAERISLVEAAALFREMARPTPVVMEQTRAAFPSPTAEESFCLQVISWTRSVAGEAAPSQGELVAQKYQEELCELLRTHGRIILPEVN